MSDREIDTMNTSSIDLICCALGGLLLIMLFVATLVRAKAEKAVLESGQGDDQIGNRAVGLEGLREAPPRLMVVRLQWTGRAKYPPQLLAYPPAWEGGAPKARDGALLANDAAALNEQKGLVRVPGGGTFFGFFSRKARRNGEGGSVELVVPRGSRQAAFWRFRVVYSDDPAVVSHSGKDPARDLHDAFGEMKGWPKSAGGHWDTTAPSIDKDERARRVDELARTAVLPLLNQLAAQAPNEADQHDRALQLVRDIDDVLDTGKARRDDITWENDLLSPSGPIERARQGGAGWLGRIHDYAMIFAGTDPRASGEIRVSIELRAYPPKPAWPIKQRLGVFGRSDETSEFLLKPAKRNDSDPALIFAPR